MINDKNKRLTKELLMITLIGLMCGIVSTQISYKYILIMIMIGVIIIKIHQQNYKIIMYYIYTLSLFPFLVKGEQISTILFPIVFVLIMGKYLYNKSQCLKIKNLPIIMIFFIINIIALFKSQNINNSIVIITKLTICILFYIIITNMDITINKKYNKYEILNSCINYLIIFTSIIMIVLIYKYIIVFKVEYVGINLNIPSKEGKNQLAFYLSMIAPFCFVKLIDEKYFINKLILKISCMINIIALSLTLSRGAIISVFIGIILSSILNKNYKILKITIFIFILAISLSPSLRDRIFSIVNVFKSETVSVGGDYSSTEVRKELIKISIRSIRENPLGIGLGNYGEITRIYGLKEVGASHNDYLQMAVETGIQGLISFILIIYYIFKSLVYVRNDIIYDYKVLYEGIVASFISVVFYLNFINAYNTLILWFILGISVYFERIIREEKNRKAIR